MGLPGCLFVCHLILLLMCFLFNHVCFGLIITNKSTKYRPTSPQCMQLSLLCYLSWFLHHQGHNITKVSNFCHFSFEGGGGSKRKLRELSCLSDIDILSHTANSEGFPSAAHRFTRIM